MNFFKIFILSACLLLANLGTAATTKQPPRTIAFDFGGVLTNEPDLQRVVYFLRESFHLSEQEFQTANALKKEAIKKGKTDEEFWLSYAKEQDISLSEDWPVAFKQVIKDSIALNPTMTDLVFELKEKQVPVALLSNIDTRLANFIREFGMYDPFDPCLLSCEIGVKKPDPQAFEILLERLARAQSRSFRDGLAELSMQSGAAERPPLGEEESPPSQGGVLQRINAPAASVVFIDDRIENVAQAKKLGIDAILFESPDQIRRELTERGLL